MSDKINVGFICNAMTAGRDRIYVGGINDTIKSFDTNGKILEKIKQGSDHIDFIAYANIYDQLIVRYHNKLLCIKLDGTTVYRKDMSGNAGVTLDRQGNIYFGSSETNNVQRITSDGKPCKEMLSKDNCINRPSGMCFNNGFTKLFVINDGGKAVYLYTSASKYTCETT